MRVRVEWNWPDMGLGIIYTKADGALFPESTVACMVGPAVLLCESTRKRKARNKI